MKPDEPLHVIYVMMKWLVLFVASVVLAGCGGTGALLPNSRASVTLESSAMSDLELIVTPRTGDVGVVDACDNNSDGFGCNRYYTRGDANYRFDTRSDASTSPFYVYVKNTSHSPVRYGLIIEMNSDEKVNFTDTIPAESTVLVARIFRYSAEDL